MKNAVECGGHYHPSRSAAERGQASETQIADDAQPSGSATEAESKATARSVVRQELLLPRHRARLRSRIRRARRITKDSPDIEDAEQERLKRLATEWRASKTGVPHVFPMTPEVQRHLDLVRELDSVFVLPIAKGSLRFVRTELKRLCQLVGVEPFGPQMVHRASVTEWGCTIQDAGSLTRHNPTPKGYYDKLLAVGKKVALIACMRKFPTILNAMIRNKQSWKIQPATA